MIGKPELKLCPFCGGEANLETRESTLWGTDSKRFSVVIDHYCTIGKSTERHPFVASNMPTEEGAMLDAVEAWNTRIAPTAEDGLRESLEECRKDFLAIRFVRVGPDNSTTGRIVKQALSRFATLDKLAALSPKDKEE